VAVYDAIKQADQVDADGDGVAAQVGLTLNVIEWLPSRDNAPSDLPEDIAAAGRVRYVYHHLVPERCCRAGSTPTWTRCSRRVTPIGRASSTGSACSTTAARVSAEPAIIPVLNLMVCFGELDLGTCVPPADPTHWVPAMSRG
jgi:hypothetical protein